MEENNTIDAEINEWHNDTPIDTYGDDCQWNLYEYDDWDELFYEDQEYFVYD